MKLKMLRALSMTIMIDETTKLTQPLTARLHYAGCLLHSKI
jgi:hypothetical protein